MNINDSDLDDDLLTGQVEEQTDTPGQYEHWRVTVDAGQQSVRIDKYLAEHMQHSSRNRIQTAAAAGCIQVNGRPVKSNYKIRPLDVITLMLDHPKHDSSIQPEEIPLDIVYEDDDVMVVNKPAGMVVHPGAGNFNGTLINAVAWHLRDLESFDANDPQVGLVHRIDKDTSGLLVVAKTPDAKTSLGKQFFNKTTHRAYNALVWGNLSDDTGRIEGNITRDPKDRLRMKVVAPDSGIGKPGCDPLARVGALRLYHACGMCAGDGTHPSDSRPHESHRPSALWRRTLWRHRDTVGTAQQHLQGVCTQLSRRVSAAGPSRQDSGLRASPYGTADGLRLAVAG